MIRRPPRFALRLGVLAVLVLALNSAIALGQVVIKVSDTVNFRVGFQLQTWADFTQDPISQGYQQSFFIRRVRFILGGNLAKDVSFFFQTDNPRMGNSIGTATKALNTGFLVQDGFLEWKVFSNDQFILDAGKMLIPLTRNSLQSTSSHLALDGGTFTFLQVAGTQSDAGRDIGFQLKSYLVGDHLEFRGGVYDGFKTPANAAGAGSRNAPRIAGRAVYNVFDTEKGYVPVGTNLGKRKILSIGGGVDTQRHYLAYGGDVMVDWPIGPGDAKTGQDAITAHVDYIHWDGSTSIPTLLPQRTLFTDMGYYFNAVKLQPFFRYEREDFTNTVDQVKNQQRFMAGLNYYVSAQQMKITAAWERIMPKTQPATATIKNSNHFVVQLQVVYF